MEMVGRLASSVIHDLNNLLTVIQLNASLIEGAGLSGAEISDAAGRIGNACERASDLTRNVLNLARRSAAEMRDVEIRELVTAMARLLESLVAKKVVFDLRLHDAELWVRGARGAFEQVLMNLILNAVDAMPGGGPIGIECGVRHVGGSEPRGGCAPGDWVVIAVTDTGCGIAPEDRDKIFEPFFTTKHASGGTGMGLFTVNRVVSAHGGTIEVESVPGRGTTFTILLPRLPLGTPASAPAASDPPPDPPAKQTVLLVEDDFGVRSLTREILERNGFAVLDAETGSDAIHAWRADPSRVDFLLTDVVLPGDLSGRDLARQFRSERPGIGVLYMSGFATGDDERPPLEGAKFLSKPFAPAALVRAVRDALRDRPRAL